jgi:two-component system phosphate regulon response regulator OmpR
MTEISQNASAAAATVVGDDAMHVLVVDDDQRIRDLLGNYLRNNGYRVTTADNAENARSSMRNLSFDLMILDVMMPGEDGLSLARSLRKTSDIPILMLTARGDADDRINGLEAGVDDYLPKPFDPRELLLRLKNIMKRRVSEPEPVAGPQDARFGNFTFNLARGELKQDGEAIKLTEMERNLLRFFAARPGATVDREELADLSGNESERSVDVQINRLRRKIEADPTNPAYLQTVRGRGYIFYFD